jgi:hypothetical protein
VRNPTSACCVSERKPDDCDSRRGGPATAPRWLLLSPDRLSVNHLIMMQELIANMLGSAVQDRSCRQVAEAGCH